MMVDRRNGRTPGRKERDERSRRFGDKGQRFEIWCETADRCVRVGWAPHYEQFVEGTLRRPGAVAAIVCDRATGQVRRAELLKEGQVQAGDVVILGPDGEAVR